VDKVARDILSRFEARADAIADEIADATVTEVTAFGPMADERLRAEVRALARQQLDAFLTATRTGTLPDASMLAVVRDRAATRARQLVPLAAMLHSFMIAQRVISAAIAREAGADASARGAALGLTALTFDYNIAATTAMADAYVEAVQGDLADLDWARRALIDALIADQSAAVADLSRRATGLGLHPDHEHVVALVTFTAPRPAHAWTSSQRRLVQALARNSTRTERQTFVVSLGTELLAVLDARSPRTVLRDAATQLLHTQSAPLQAGIGTPFTGIARLRDSYHAARRALRHTAPERPILQAPDDLHLFDDLTASRSDDTDQLIAPALREALADPQVLHTLQAWIDHDLNVAATARALCLHPNSVRYRLRRITQLTGYNPHHLADLIELHTAARLLSRASAGAASDQPVRGVIAGS
jgi:PucR C-terminal helix-turn-helix domain/GGDEF-like domain